MRVRIIRTVQVKAARFHDFLELSLKAAEHVAKQTSIQPDVYWARFGDYGPTDVKIFMDFDSMAQYEKLFLEGLLFDKDYLLLAEQGADMIKLEPNDELLVLMDRDDYFMNLKGAVKDPTRATPARGSIPPRRYRLVRHVDVQTGKLREFMKTSFDFMDRFEHVTKFRPDLFCTRFTRERIGCGKMFFDFDECPMCDPILMEHARDLVARHGELLERDHMDELYVRVTQRDVSFTLQAATAAS